MTGRPNYRIKCERCGKFVYREEMSFNYGRKTCHDCLRIQIITKTCGLYIPSFIIKLQKIKPYDQVIISNTPEGIIIRKKKKNEN